jgi:hypothetical protein
MPTAALYVDDGMIELGENVNLLHPVIASITLFLY